MNKYIFCIITTILSSVNLSASEENYASEIYLQNRIPESNHRYHSFLLALQLLQKNNVKIIVETGTARQGIKGCLGDGCSTLIFSDWASHNEAILYSVDINLENLEVARECIEPFVGHVKLVHDDSINFLSNFNHPIDFLYLDSFDYEIHNPLPSQLHHLHEIEAAYEWLHEKSIILIDDCGIQGEGKGKFVIQYLKERGWKIIFSQYQVLLTM